MNGFQVVTENIAAHATKPQVERLLDHWSDLFSRFGRIPSYAEFQINGFADCQDNLMVLQPVENDYFYLMFGAGVVRDGGADMTGRKLSQTDKPVGVKLKACYDESLRRERPVFAVHPARYRVSVHSWERLVLPVGGARTGELLLVVYNAPRETKHDILDAILQASTNGILAITPVFDDDEQICDGVIIAANMAIEAIVGNSRQALVDQRILQTFPGLRNNGVWDRYLAAFESGQSDRFEMVIETGGSESIFQVGVAAFNGGLTVTFADIGELVGANRSLKQKSRELAHTNAALEKQARELASLAEALELNRETLHQEMKRREELEAELRRIANTDELTGIPNRRSFIEKSKTELRRAKRTGQTVSVLVLDVDRFKSFNDSYGHAIGDHVLRIVARRIRECIRESIDVYGRIGGEEFAVLLPETETEGAYAAADRLRRKIEESYVGISGKLVRVTASFGIATWAGFDESLQGILHRADAALYLAKRLGRNRVEVDMPMADSDNIVLAIERDRVA